MNKIVVRRPGGFKRLELSTEAEPAPGPGEARVSTRSIGVNYADCIVRMGLYKSAREFVGWPITPGFEFSGVVSAVGDGVHDLNVGDRVFGLTRFGGYASDIVVPRRQVLSLPPELDFAQGATFGVVFLTAWYALFQLCDLHAGDKVLVHSAAGGVGSALCQLARAAGCQVMGVVSGEHKREAALAQGAELVVDKTREDMWAAARSFAPGGFQVVLDANGPETLQRSYEHLASRGRLVIYGFHTLLPRGGLPNPLGLLYNYLRTPSFKPLDMVDKNVGVLAFNLSYLFDELDLLRSGMQDLLSKLASGQLRPLAVREFPLANAGDAHRSLQSGRTVGKLALIP